MNTDLGYSIDSTQKSQGRLEKKQPKFVVPPLSMR